MGLLKIFLVLIAIGSGGAAVYLFWNNRASETVQMNALSTVTAGVLAVAIAIVFSAKSETKEVEFLTVYTIEKSSKLPLVPTNALWLREYTERSGIATSPSSIIDFLKQNNPKLFTNDHFGIEIYTGVTLQNIFGALAFGHTSTWRSKVRRFAVPGAGAKFATAGPDGRPYPSDYFTFDQLQELFPKCHFARIIPSGPFAQFAIPQGTKVSAKDNRGEKELTLANSFCNVTVTVSQGMGMVGAGGLKDVHRKRPIRYD